MNIDFFKKQFSILSEAENQIIKEFKKLKLEDFSKEDKLYLFNKVLSHTGERELFPEGGFISLIKTLDTSFDLCDYWERYQVIEIQSLLECVKDNYSKHSDYDQVVNKIIDLALTKNIYSFEYDW